MVSCMINGLYFLVIFLCIYALQFFHCMLTSSFCGISSTQGAFSLLKSNSQPRITWHGEGFVAYLVLDSASYSTYVILESNSPFHFSSAHDRALCFYFRCSFHSSLG
ncbi:hypothetical protein Droror1_Dr00009359 [Drosera rotundifolia]